VNLNVVYKLLKTNMIGNASYPKKKQKSFNSKSNLEYMFKML